MRSLSSWVIGRIFSRRFAPNICPIRRLGGSLSFLGAFFGFLTGFRPLTGFVGLAGFRVGTFLGGFPAFPGFLGLEGAALRLAGLAGLALRIGLACLGSFLVGLAGLVRLVGFPTFLTGLTGFETTFRRFLTGLGRSAYLP